MDTLLKLSVYDDRGAQQGRAVAHLTGQGEEGQRCEGHVWLSRLVAIEDPYFDWWHDKTYAGGAVPLHACARQAQRCTQGTLYRNVLHMDVFRILPGRSAMGLKWLSDDEKARIEGIINSRPTGTAPAGRSAGGEPGKAGTGVATGAPGIEGLAAALGHRGAEDEMARKEKEDAKRRRLEKAFPAEPKEPTESKDLGTLIQNRAAAAPELSALKMKVRRKRMLTRRARRARRIRKRLDRETAATPQSPALALKTRFFG